MTVGLFHSPAARETAVCCAARRACLRSPPAARVSSPQIYPPGLTNISSSKLNSLPKTCGPSRPSARAAADFFMQYFFLLFVFVANVKDALAARRSAGPPRSFLRSPDAAECVRMKRSLNVPGSLSSALHTMNFSGPAACRTNCHFIRWGILPRPARGVRTFSAFQAPHPNRAI